MSNFFGTPPKNADASDGALKHEARNPKNKLHLEIDNTRNAIDRSRHHVRNQPSIWRYLQIQIIPHGVPFFRYGSYSHPHPASYPFICILFPIQCIGRRPGTHPITLAVACRIVAGSLCRCMFTSCWIKYGEEIEAGGEAEGIGGRRI